MLLYQLRERERERERKTSYVFDEEAYITLTSTYPPPPFPAVASQAERYLSTKLFEELYIASKNQEFEPYPRPAGYVAA
jgi:hypothetical protein